ncbi:EamA-like transporter family protein [Martelella lutilitoris]|uniref:EamA-like transporter family protein n=1 Tax=Martelella lutilitoris TaxID=2583532 RepID=A0A5C4JX60_9HYPH|nr:DMT family transporter [Martelella lutilitoris]TNB49810.1 EamA-like transporter family protein [Martelella lutilitoris]
MPSTLRPSLIYFLAAFAAGCIMAVMTHLNAVVALYGSPMYASWAGHGCGTIAAVAILVFLHFRKSGAEESDPKVEKIRVPWWGYLGGVSGAATVVAASLAVNSPLALSGAIALGLGGQVLFSLAADQWGLFGLPARRLDLRDLAAVVFILAGSILVIMSGGAQA